MVLAAFYAEGGDISRDPKGKVERMRCKQKSIGKGEILTDMVLKEDRHG